MPIFARWIAAVVTALLLTAPALAADRTIIILDASGSMWGQIDGKPKLEIARQSLRTVLQSLPADREVGFMAYGHREKGSCEDIELIVPPAAGTAGAITAAADSMKFLGKTPLTAAVRKAAEALKYNEDKATVVLITDGLETCNADPCALGKELKASGVDFTAHVVGFGLTADEGRQVACLAENTGGKYIQATDAAGLEDALKQTVAVTANTNYRLTVWVRSSSNVNNAWLGAKTTTSSVLGELRHGQAAGYTRYVVTFNSGSNTAVNVHVGLWGAGTGTWEQIDDAWLQQL